jgi:hypothetical protein
MPFWLIIAVAIIIHVLLFLQWIEINTVREQMKIYGGTVTLHWPFFVTHAAAIVFWCWVIFG